MRAPISEGGANIGAAKLPPIDRLAEETRLFAEYQTAFREACECPNLNRFRAAVDAYDAFAAIFTYPGAL